MLQYGVAKVVPINDDVAATQLADQPDSEEGGDRRRVLHKDQAWLREKEQCVEQLNELPDSFQREGEQAEESVLRARQDVRSHEDLGDVRLRLHLRGSQGKADGARKPHIAQEVHGREGWGSGWPAARIARPGSPQAALAGCAERERARDTACEGSCRHRPTRGPPGPP